MRKLFLVLGLCLCVGGAVTFTACGATAVAVSAFQHLTEPFYIHASANAPAEIAIGTGGTAIAATGSFTASLNRRNDDGTITAIMDIPVAAGWKGAYRFFVRDGKLGLERLSCSNAVDKWPMLAPCPDASKSMVAGVVTVWTEHGGPTVK